MVSYNYINRSNFQDREVNPLPFTGLVPFKIRNRIYDFRQKVDTTYQFVDYDWRHLIQLTMDAYNMGMNEGMNQRSMLEYMGSDDNKSG